MPLIGFLASTGHIIPESDARVKSKGEDIPTIWRETNSGDRGVVFVDKGSETLASGCIPYSTRIKSAYKFIMRYINLHETICGTATNQSPIPNEVYPSNRIRMCWQTSHLSSSSEIPQKYGLVITSTDQHVSLR